MGFGPATGLTLKTALCHIRALVGRMMNTEVCGRSFWPFVWPFLSSCWVAFDKPSYLWVVLPGVPQHLKRGMPTGPKVFLTSPDALVGRMINNRGPQTLSGATRLHEVESYVSWLHSTHHPF